MDENIGELASRLSSLTVKLDGNIELQRELLSNVKTLVLKHDEVLYDGRNEGLLIRVDRLEKEAETRKWLFRTSVGSLIAVAGKTVWDILHYMGMMK